MDSHCERRPQDLLKHLDKHLKPPPPDIRLTKTSDSPILIKIRLDRSEHARHIRAMAISNPSLLTTAVLLSFATAPLHHPHAEPFTKPHISVYGTAVTDAVPDLMRWQLSFRTLGPTVSAVAKAHEARVARVIGFLGREEIEEKKIQTSQVQLGEDIEYRGGTRVKKGYYASTSITFESQTLEAYQSLWTGLSQFDNVTINGVSFDTSERLKIQQATRIKALQAAELKAFSMAKVLRKAIGGPLLIEEEASANPDQRQLYSKTRMARIASDQEAAGPSLSVGTIPIRMRVKAVFELRPWGERSIPKYERLESLSQGSASD